VPAYRELTVEAAAQLSGIVEARFGDATALRDGRVFVDGKRTHVDTRVRAGQRVRVGTRTEPGAAPEILFEDRDLIVINKMSGVSTIPDTRGTQDSALGALTLRFGKLHATSRLDREVSGVVIFARSEQAVTTLRQARTEGTYARTYLALSHSSLPLALGEKTVWNAPIGRAKNPHLREISGQDAAPAETHAHCIASTPNALLWRLQPQTGRTHQLRLHASHAGFPLLGDSAYGGKRTLAGREGRVHALSRIMLHAARVEVPQGSFAAPIPEAMRDLWAALEGAPAAWVRALE
jgi:23S rRNA pseudouridine1911/1915/1917 synthase